MQHNIPQLLDWVESGLLLDLTPFINSGAINTANIPQAVLDHGRVGNGIYGISMGTNAASMIYDRSLTDSLGITVPRNMTLDQFAAISREIFQRTGIKTSYTGEQPTNPLIAHLRGQGVERFVQAPNGGWRLGGSVANYEAFFEFIAMGAREGWMTTSQDWGGRNRSVVDTNPLVYPPNLDAPNLRSWISINWANQITAFSIAAGAGQTLALTTLPSANPQRSNFGRGSMVFSITRDAQNPAEAARLVDFFVNSMDAHDIMLGERGMPSNTAAAARIAPNLSPANQMQAEFVAWVNQPANSTPFFGMEPAGTEELNAEIGLVSEMVLTGQLTAAEAAARIWQRGQELIR
jgi:multiple sugar transport system substrate-binding protein